MSTASSNFHSRNTIALQRGLILAPPGDGNDGQLAASLQAELMKLGIALDADAFAAVAKAPRAWVVDYHDEVIAHLRQRMGANHPYRPFYGNFPAQVMEMSDVELFLNAIVHYWSNGAWEPPQALRNRGLAFEKVEFRKIRLGTDADLMRAFTEMVSLNQSLTANDKEILGWLIDTYSGQLICPEVIPFKETLCILAAKGLEAPVTTPTDVLRIAVYLSSGDISLPGVPKLNVNPIEAKDQWSRWYVEQMAKARLQEREAFKFKKFSRGQRRLILGLLEKTNLDVTEMQRHLGRWLRLGEVLHPGEFALRYPRSAEAFQRLRNQRKGTKIRTFPARVDLAFGADWQRGVDLLASRPGEFARRLDWMLRNFDRGYVLEAFNRISPQVSAKVLIELYNHFRQRYQANAPRSIMIKGARAKSKVLPPLPPMDPDLVQQVGNAILKVMRDRMAKLPALGKVWLDDKLAEVPVPFAMRSVNTAVRTYVRGTRIPFRVDAKVVRAFIHWFDENGSVDLDLSVGLYDASLKSVGHVSFTGLKDLGCCHSGDIRHRRGPCAEYVDIPIESAMDHGVRYAAVHAFNYDGQPMHTVKECVFGLMEREHAEANEIFVPKTISNCMALANEGTGVVVCVIDLVKRNYIWADVESMDGIPVLENAASATADVLRSLVHGTKMSVHELLALHAQSRGVLVPGESQAEVVWKWEAFVADYAKVGAFMSF